MVIAVFKQQPVHSILYILFYTARIGCNQECTAGDGFNTHQAKRLPNGRQHNNFGSPVMFNENVFIQPAAKSDQGFNTALFCQSVVMLLHAAREMDMNRNVSGIVKLPVFRNGFHQEADPFSFNRMTRKKDVYIFRAGFIAENMVVIPGMNDDRFTPVFLFQQVLHIPAVCCNQIAPIQNKPGNFEQ